jgi:hypothetical protein
MAILVEGGGRWAVERAEDNQEKVGATNRRQAGQRYHQLPLIPIPF